MWAFSNTKYFIGVPHLPSPHPSAQCQINMCIENVPNLMEFSKLFARDLIMNEYSHFMCHFILSERDFDKHFQVASAWTSTRTASGQNCHALTYDHRFFIFFLRHILMSIFSIEMETAAELELCRTFQSTFGCVTCI